jgi:hypothetical protein
MCRSFLNAVVKMLLRTPIASCSQPALSLSKSNPCLCVCQVLVVKSYEAITRLRAAAQQAKVPIPAMLTESLIQVGVQASRHMGKVQVGCVKGGRTLATPWCRAAFVCVGGVLLSSIVSGIAMPAGY